MLLYSIHIDLRVQNILNAVSCPSLNVSHFEMISVHNINIISTLSIIQMLLLQCRRSTQPSTLCGLVK